MNHSDSHIDGHGDLLDLELLDRHALDLFARAGDLVHATDPASAPAVTDGDDEGLVVTGAVVLASHLRVLMGLTVSDDDRRDVVVDLTDTARDCRVASHAAIGAMSLLADAAVRLDVVEFGALLGEALDVITAADLFEASASLLTAMALIIGERLDLDPVTVIEEMAGSAVRRSVPVQGGAATECETTMRQPRSIPNGRGQTCPGRNSQCQGSLGTASTQPKRGPFVFNH